MKSLILFSIIVGIHFQSRAHLNPPQIISLIPPGAHEVLERENLLTTLCPPKSTRNLNKCRSEKLKPVTWELTLYKEASPKSSKVGNIRITAIPGKGVQAEYSTDQKQWHPLKSDSTQTDWGYSSYFEFTVKDIRNDWIQLPRRPFPEPVWINLKRDWPLRNADEVLPLPAELQTDFVYSVEPLGNIVILNFSGQNIVYRNENKNDMLCGDEPQPVSAKELKEFTKPVDVLFDTDGHLKAWPAYPRGC